MRHSRHDHAINIGQNFVHGFALDRGRAWQLAEDVARLYVWKSRKIADVCEEVCDPIYQLMAVLTKLFSRHITEADLSI